MVVGPGLEVDIPNHDSGSTNILGMLLSNCTAPSFDNNSHTKIMISLEDPSQWRVELIDPKSNNYLQLCVVCLYSWLCLIMFNGLRSTTESGNGGMKRGGPPCEFLFG